MSCRLTYRRRQKLLVYLASSAAILYSEQDIVQGTTRYMEQLWYLQIDLSWLSCPRCRSPSFEASSLHRRRCWTWYSGLVEVSNPSVLCSRTPTLDNPPTLTAACMTEVDIGTQTTSINYVLPLEVHRHSATRTPAAAKEVDCVEKHRRCLGLRVLNTIAQSSLADLSSTP